MSKFNSHFCSHFFSKLSLTGGTSLFAKGHSPEACLENLRDNQVPHTLLTNEEATAKYPMIRFGSEIEWVLEEASMGAVYADRCLRVTVVGFNILVLGMYSINVVTRLSIISMNASPIKKIHKHQKISGIF